MLAMRVRVRPCRARWKPSSEGRSTRTTPSSRTMRTSGWNVCSRVPRGPFTETRVPSTETSTPPGTSMGCLPILLMPSPDVCQHFAAQAGSSRLAVRHQPLGRGQDGHPQAAHHPRQRVALRVHPPPRLGHPLQPGDDPLPAPPVLELDPDGLLHALALALEGLDVALLLEDPGDGLVHLGGWDVQ